MTNISTQIEVLKTDKSIGELDICGLPYMGLRCTLKKHAKGPHHDGFAGATWPALPPVEEAAPVALVKGTPSRPMGRRLMTIRGLWAVGVTAPSLALYRKFFDRSRPLERQGKTLIAYRDRSR